MNKIVLKVLRTAKKRSEENLDEEFPRLGIHVRRSQNRKTKKKSTSLSIKTDGLCELEVL